MRWAGILAGTAIVLAPVPALADTKSYRVDAYSETTIDLSICSPIVSLTADGDNDTDLDFWIYDAQGNLVASDTDSTDLMYATLYRRGSSGCTPYRLQVSNLGGVYNEMQLTLTGEGEGGSNGTYRVDANSTYSLNLNVCSSSLDIWVNGDNDTDLDFYLYDPQNRLVFSDTDTTDLMIYTLNSKAKSGACLPYRLDITNLGNVYNQFEVRLTE